LRLGLFPAVYGFQGWFASNLEEFDFERDW